MRGQIRGLEMASKNSQDGISLIQTAEGALNETHSILQRMRELAVQSANDTNTDDDRAKIQSEVDELFEEISRIASATEFNTQKLLNSGVSLKFHIGANSGQNITLSINKMNASAILGATTISISTQTGANAAIATINSAIKTVSEERANLGAYQNRLEHTINNLGTSAENLTAAESRVRDVDMAKEMMEQTKNSILSQAAQAMLAQANQQPQGVLQLLR
jgi:flagellin